MLAIPPNEPAGPIDQPCAARASLVARHVADQRSRHSRMFSIAIRAAGVTIRVRIVAKPRPNTIAVERWIHHCVAGAPTVISHDTNSKGWCVKLAPSGHCYANHRIASTQGAGSARLFR